MILLIASISRRERSDAPPPPPPVPGEAGMPLGPSSPFDPGLVIAVPRRADAAVGTAFSIADTGVWITSRHAVERCARVVIVVAEGRGIPAQVRNDPASETATLITEGGAAPLPSASDEPLHLGERAFHPGFPHGQAGEVTSHLLGWQTLSVRNHRRSHATATGASPSGERSEVVLVWAESGRTDGLRGTLAGLSGAPALDRTGRVIGVTVAESPRRGRIYTTAPASISAALAVAGLHPPTDAVGELITTENYGRVADSLRRDLRVAKVVCLPRI